ncbi:gamma-glutamylcyclotransferase family protein, partial [Mycobacteroides abscessus subsp. massiliense]|uniref:gamma-glutamylcyclotransferase family protein n=1 Tax=Mycobacteroides abscessus TaxID=36809 RepID=UPI003CF816F0
RGGRHGAVATVEKKSGGSVPILVWEITPADEAALDRYEGWPHLYRKETIRVQLNGKPVSAMIYIMNEGRTFGSPSPYYFSVIVHGYHSSGFDIDI